MFTIRELKASDYQNGKKVTFEYVSEWYYDLQVERQENNMGWEIKLIKKEFPQPFNKQMEVEILEEYKTNLSCCAAYLEEREVGILSYTYEAWNNVVRIWDLYLHKEAHGKGLGKQLLQQAITAARKRGARAVVLETQTSNYNAIQFYLSQGFELIGFDCISYSNQDIEKHEVRLEMGRRISS